MTPLAQYFVNHRQAMPSFVLLEFKDLNITVYSYWVENDEVKIEETVITK